MLAYSPTRSPSAFAAPSTAPSTAAASAGWSPQALDAQDLIGNQALLARATPGGAARDPFSHFMAVERAEKSTGWHMSFLDKGLPGSFLQGEVDAIPARLAQTPAQSGAVGAGPLRGDAPMPARGQAPAQVQDLPWLHADIRNASLAVASWDEQGQLQARWYGRNDRANDQHWSATKHIQALGLVSLVNRKRPDLDIDDLLIREAGKEGTGVPLFDLLQDVVSYDAGPQRSNAGAKTLSRFQSTTAREAQLESWTGHDVDFRGGYGAAAIFQRPELVTRAGEVVATAPAAAGASGPNLVGSQDLTRAMAMAAWHPHLGAEQRIPDAQWHSLESVLRSMGWDSARYIDEALELLGVEDQLENVVVATKLGHGIRDATRNAETVYTGVVQLDDVRGGARIRRSMAFTIRGEHRDPVTLDARIAAEVTEIIKRLLAGEL